MRSAFLPSVIDPFVDLLWLRNFRTWDSEIDRLYVYLNSDMEKPVADFLIAKFKEHPKATVFYHKGMTQHGSALAELTRAATEEYILWIEEDGYILKKGTVDEHFKLLESGQYDAIGSPRTSSSMDLQRVGSRRFNVDISGVGDKGIAFWPNFFFCKRSDLLRTDMDFNAHQWMKGEYVKELDWKVEPDNGVDVRGDTFVWGSIQMRALGLRIKEVRQFHAFPYWEGDYNCKANIFSPEANWFHAGSLSGSLNGILTDEYGNPLSMRELHLPPKPEGWQVPIYAHSESEKKEFQRRCAFYLLAYELFHDELKPIEDFANHYLEAVKRVIAQYKLDDTDIQRQKQVYRALLKV